MKIIGLTGFAGSGKDFTANLLHSELKKYKYKVYWYALADPLKQECADILGVPLDYFYSAEHKPFFRPFMTFTGDYKKNPKYGGHEAFFTDKFKEQVTVQSKVGTDVFLLTDVRDDFEAKFLIELGGQLIEITNPNTSKGLHSTEQGIQDKSLIYSTIHNDPDAPLAYLIEKVQNTIVALNLLQN